MSGAQPPEPEEDPAFWDKVDRKIKERKEEPELHG